MIASITLVDDRQTIALSGSLDFGNVLQGETEEKIVTIANNGNATLEVTSIETPEGFTASVTTGVIGPNSTLSVTITFAPTELRTYNGSILVTSNAVSGSNEIAVSGVGTTITGFNEPGQVTGELTVYPNPGNGFFILSGKMTERVSITDLSGKQRSYETTRIDEEKHTLDITSLPQGVYYLRVEEKGSVAVKRIVKLN